MSRSFRHVLAIRLAVLTTVGMSLCAAGTLLVLRRSVDGELDANILNVAAIQAAALTDAATGEMHFHEWDLTPDEAASIRDLVRYAQVWSEEGRSLLRSQYMTGDLPTNPEALRAAAAGQLIWEDSTFEGIPVRSVLYPLSRLGEVHAEHVLQVAAPLGPRNAMLGRAVLFGVVLVLLAGLGSAVGGRWVADRVIRPVSEIMDEAEAVGAGTLRRRIEARPDTREYERLVHVLNDMLDRIQAAFDAQRRFTADASHELRSPLTAMRGEMDLALRRERSSEEYRDVLNSAREEVVRLSRIVEGLLTLARSDSGAMHPRLVRRDLTELLEEVVGRTSAEAEARGVDLRLVGSGRLPAVFDPDLVSQMIGNLVQNAVRFAGSGGQVGVSVSQAGTDAVITVEDSGPGVPPGGERAVFERFWRADPSRTPARAPEGIGLGLAIARAIAEAHGGSISASNNSTLGGARLEVRVPILSDPSPADPARRSSEPAIA